MLIRKTRSLCPVCLRTLEAELNGKGGEVFMERTCPEHGFFSSVIWRGTPDFSAWARPKRSSGPMHRETARKQGCPHDCGLCEEHAQHTCTVLFEITHACNLRCPVCFASSGDAGPDSFTPFARLSEQLDWIAARTPDAVLQISGGEPTLHPDLTLLVRKAASLFPAVQLNSNGLLLASRPELCRELAQAGLSWVFLQFDGTTDEIFETMRGTKLLAHKIRAIENCRAAQLPVVLVPTLAKGVNDHNLGEMLDFALGYSPAVRGIHIQPMADMGRNSLAGALGAQITLPEVLSALSAQSKGRIAVEHAIPPGCEHERCSFHCRYILGDEGGLKPILQQACCTGTALGGLGSGKGSLGAELPMSASLQGDKKSDDGGAQKAISTIIRNWGMPEPAVEDDGAEDELSRFIRQARQRTFSVTCMAFQDALTVDLERLQGCCVHVFSAPDKLIPFCAYNLTSLDGTPLYRPAPPGKATVDG